MMKFIAYRALTKELKAFNSPMEARAWLNQLDFIENDKLEDIEGNFIALITHECNIKKVDDYNLIRIDKILVKAVNYFYIVIFMFVIFSKNFNFTFNS